jgi:hypothetical protein
LFILTGCASYKLDVAQGDLRNSFVSGNYEQASDLMASLDKKDVYKSKDQVLKNLEYGTILHFAGRYDSSITYFNRAEDLIEANYTKSITQGAASLLLSDNALSYDGEEYENVYLNAFKALNFLHQGDLESALVESRRIAFKLEQLDIRINGLASVLEKKDSTAIANWEPNKVNVQSSALSRYLATVLYAKTGKFDDARIEYDRLKLSIIEQDNIRRFYGPDIDNLPDLYDANSYNVLLSAFTGVAPIKEQEDFRLFIGDNDLYVKFSIPRLFMYDTQVNNIRVVVDDREEYYLNMIEEMDAVAADIFYAKRPVVYARALARSVLKATGTSKITKRARKEGEGWGLLAFFLGIIGQEVSEKADLRAWQTLPGQSWMQVINLPPGDHQLRMQYLDYNDRVLYEERKEITVKPSTRLELFESIYSY